MIKNYILNYNNAENVVIFSTDDKNVKLIKQVIPYVSEWKVGKVFEDDDREYIILSFLKKAGINADEVDLTVTEKEGKVHIELDIPESRSADLWGTKIDQKWPVIGGTLYVLKNNTQWAVVRLTEEQYTAITGNVNFGLNGNNAKCTAEASIETDIGTYPGLQWTALSLYFNSDMPTTLDLKITYSGTREITTINEYVGGKLS